MLLSSPCQLTHQPKRIISLVPSQTELLFELGLDDAVVGITKFCIHPKDWRKTKTIIGGTKNINPEKIKSLNPDLIIANKEENVKEQVKALAIEYPVYVSDISTLNEAINMMNDIGILTNTTLKANTIINNIKQGFDGITPANNISTAYFIWRNPYMTVGGDTFIHDMLARCGFSNIYAAQTRYPEVDINKLKEKKCQLLLLSSEPYPFKQKHIDELQEHLPNTRIILADGEMFSWYGSRLLHSPAYFSHFIKSL
jgi:ABC-type Fe3+-hydroxamate transport system substrate-binding protein